MRMRPAITLTAFGLLLAGYPAAAQTPPDENQWDISKIDVSKLPPASAQQGVTFEKDVLPLLKASCVRCHGEQRAKENLRLDSLEAVLKGGKDGKMVVAGDSKQSLLFAAAAQIDDKIAMPPKRRPRGGPPAGSPANGGQPPAQPGGQDGGPGRGGPPPKPLTAEQVGLIRAWIDQGAK